MKTYMYFWSVAIPQSRHSNGSWSQVTNIQLGVSAVMLLYSSVEILCYNPGPSVICPNLTHDPNIDCHLYGTSLTIKESRYLTGTGLTPISLFLMLASDLDGGKTVYIQHIGPIDKPQ